MKKIKVFIVEDSILMQKIIADILTSDPQIEVLGASKFGKEALEKIPKISPDVVTLDVNLPDINGLKVLEELMKNCPVRVVMLSAYTQRSAEVTIKALELGALDFIPKPSGEVSLDLYNFKNEVIAKIKMVATVDLGKFVSLSSKGIALNRESLSVKKLVIMGASTGGPQAILEQMSAFTPDLDVSFLIVQHMPPGFTKSFAERISWQSHFKTKEAEEGDLIVKKAAYVAPAGYHMVIEKVSCQEYERYNIRLDQNALVNYVRPAVDVTMVSAAEAFEGSIIGVILTGMGKDGLEGARKIKAGGGKIVVQNERSCVIYGMPRAVAEANLADDILPLVNIGKRITEYLRNG